MKKYIRVDVDDSGGSPVTIHDSASGYTADLTSGMTFSASYATGSDTADKAFDNNNATKWGAGTTSRPQWIECDFGAGNEKQIQKITLTSYSGSTDGIPDSFELRASNNGTDWDTLLSDSMVKIVSTTNTYTFINHTDYRYYRIYVISTYNIIAPIIIEEIEMMEEVYTRYCISVEYPHNFGESLSTINVKFRTSANDGELDEGRLIQIWSKDTLPVGNADADRIFKGYIDSSKTEGKIITVIAKDYLVKAQWKRGTTSEDYDAQTSIKTIFTALCTLAGLTASNSATATSPVNLEQFYCNNTNVFERMTQLANITGWYFYYDPTTAQTVKFQPKSELALQQYYFGGVNNNMLSLPDWNDDARDLVNDIDVIGGNNKINKTWTTTPDGSNWYQVEDQTLENVVVYGTGTEVSGAPKTSWTYPTEYNISDNGYIMFKLDKIPDNGTGTLKVDYSYSQTGTSNNAANAGSKTTYQTREGVSHKRDMINSTDLSAYATNMVSNTFWGKPISNITFVANTKLITPIVGSMVNVTDAVSSRSITYASNNSIIINVTDSWPKMGAKVTVSTKPIKKPDLITTVQDTINKLSNEFNKLEWEKYMKMDGTTSFQSDIDMGSKEMLNAVFQKVADAAARGNINAVEGQVVYQQDNDTAYIYDGAAWDVLGGEVGSDHSALSNLTWSTAGHTIDANIIPTSDSTRDLGSSTYAFANLYVDALTGKNSTIEVNKGLDMNDNDITGADTIQATASQSLTLKVTAGQSIIFQAV